MKGFKLLACLALFVLTASQAMGIDFKIRGEWGFNFNVGENRLLKSYNDNGKKTTLLEDRFLAAQRIRLFLDAIASENLSAGVVFQIGMQAWGRAAQGAALGADGTNQIKVREAFINWRWPTTDLSTKMGIQTIRLPNKAGGPAVFACRVAGIVVNYPFSDNLGLTAFWMRPFNDNYNGYKNSGGINVNQGYLDNLDLFGFTLPLKFDGFEITPWAMYGMKGKNTLWQTADNGNVSMVRDSTAGYANYTLYPYSGLLNRNSGYSNNSTGKSYGSLFWAGLPLQVTMLDPWNIEFDFNYGYVESMGRYNAWNGAISPENLRRSSTERQGWLAKALVEYKFDWGIPGVFGWYASGDDSSPKNGSERMPSLAAYGNFTSFIADNYFTLGNWHDMDMDYSGTWGVGLQMRDFSFLSEKVKSVARVAWWGGTNSPSMIKYMVTSHAWNDGIYFWEGPYLTTNDGLLEANWITDYKMYENFTVSLELGYVANFVDNSSWDRAGAHNTTFSKQDAWKAQARFYYRF